MNITTPISTSSAAAETLGFDADRLGKIPGFLQSYIDSGKLAGTSVLISRHGEVAQFEVNGNKDRENALPLEKDSIFRIYSMTKPITSLALMMLYEEGKLQLIHPVSHYIPAFADLQVWDEGTWDNYTTKAPEREMRVYDLLTHTSGLTYDFMMAHPVDKLYRKNKLGGAGRTKLNLEEIVDGLAKMPLQFSPGTKWNYSMATDVCGRLVEIISGQTLDVFLKERIFDPLGMVDTGFYVPEDKWDRFAPCYRKDPVTGVTGRVDEADATGQFTSKPAFLSGGGGLVSTQSDYLAFCQMLLNGGEANGKRFVSPKTIDLMTMNHLPDNKTMREMDNSAFSETGMDGVGFGLGFSVLLDQGASHSTGTPGIYSWGGLASTYFWIDPVEDLTVIFMTQLMPSSSYPIRPQLQQLVYAAMID